MATTMPPGYRSATEYKFSDEQADGIIRTTAYHRQDYDLSVIWFPHREHAYIRPSIATPFQRTPNASLGPLDRLPLELFHGILFHLDIHSLFKFRQVSHSSRQMVDSLHQYQMVVSHGLNLFCALLRTKLANELSLSDFYTALCTKACFLCGEFAGFINLLIWKKCCFKCLQEAAETRVRTFASAMDQSYLPKFVLSDYRSFRTMPGTYTLKEAPFKTPAHEMYLISPRKLYGYEPPEYPPDRKFSFMASCALAYYDRRTGEIEHGVSCAGCQLAIEKDIVGGRGVKWPYEARDKVYARDGFLEHFRWCEQAQLLWESSDGGRIQPDELPEGARKGGYFGKEKKRM